MSDSYTDLQLRQVASELTNLYNRETIRDFRPIILPSQSNPEELSLSQLSWVNSVVSSRLSGAYVVMRNVLSKVQENLENLDLGYFQATLSELANPYIEKSQKLPATTELLNKMIYTFPFDANGVSHTVGIVKQYFIVNAYGISNKSIYFYNTSASIGNWSIWESSEFGDYRLLVTLSNTVNGIVQLLLNL